MDFIFSNLGHTVEELSSAIISVGGGQSPEFEFSSELGAVSATSNPYNELNPLVYDGQALIVVGDPLVDPVVTTGGSKKGTRRTFSLFQDWKRVKTGSNPIFHPAALMLIGAEGDAIDVVTDFGGFVQVYYRQMSEGIVISTSPDLIAKLLPSRLDLISAKEKAACGQISFPYTLYEDVHQFAPGASFTITRGSVAASCWYKAPCSSDNEDIHLAIRSAVTGSLDRIFAANSGPAFMTLTAGSDTRYLADVVAQSAKASVTCISCTARENLESWTAARVARTLGLEFRHFPRQPDHHTRVLSEMPYLVGTQLNWEHAHFLKRGLGDLAEGSFLIGGYLADTLLVGKDLYNLARDKKLLKENLEDSSSHWTTNDLDQFIKTGEIKEILQRRNDFSNLLSNYRDMPSRLARVFPGSRMWTMAHFGALRREYADYEPFMSLPVFNFAWQLQASGKKIEKSDLLLISNKALKKIRKNPDSDSELRRSIRILKQIVPQKSLPDFIRFPGSWSEEETQFSTEFSLKLNAICEIVAARLDFDIPVTNRDKIFLYTIYSAMLLSGEIHRDESHLALSST